MKKSCIHFTHKELLQPLNPVKVHLIGAGGTGSQMLTALARINHSLIALGHTGLQVQVFDDDMVTTANLGRQLFSHAEVGLNKGAVLINRINRFFGSNWKAIPERFTPASVLNNSAAITISCVDTVAARIDIATGLKTASAKQGRDRPLYWMDFGNGQCTGQVILSTVTPINQPRSNKYQPITDLPFITDEYADILNSTDEHNLPSCSLVEALTKQDLFINSALANMGASLLWQLFREGMIRHRGFFINLKDFRTQPVSL